MMQARQKFENTWKTPEVMLSYYTKEIDPRVAYLRELKKEAT